MIREPETDAQGDVIEPAHPVTFHITAAARAYLRACREADRYDNLPPGVTVSPFSWAKVAAKEGRVAAAEVWVALTGLDADAAHEYAETIERDAVTAAIVPF